MSDYAVTNPATGETLATYPTATDAEVEEAVAIARAHAAWISGLPDRLAPVLSDQERLLRANLAGDAVDVVGSCHAPTLP